ncbi:MAG: hypothetical protein JWM19_582 [Actinomycetia bacterium]|nr:hypothetical protein [Actinomycetes bacterium]
MTRMPDIDLASISPVTDAQAAGLASPTAFADLGRQITAQPLFPDQISGHGSHVRYDERWSRAQHASNTARRWSRPRALLAGLSLAALAGAVALVVALLAPGGVAGNSANSAAAIQALAFTKASGYITVTIRNPYADPAWYNADFARHHLDITLQVVPVSPSLVGTVIAESTSPGADQEVQTITSRRCWTGGGGPGSSCPVGLRVPVDFHGQADITFGRPARQGEQYGSTASIFAPGEALAGLLAQVAAQPLSKVRAVLASHQLTIAVCRNANNNNVDPNSVPGDYYVTSILPWAPGEVIVWTAPTRTWQGMEHVSLPTSTG